MSRTKSSFLRMLCSHVRRHQLLRPVPLPPSPLIPSLSACPDSQVTVQEVQALALKQPALLVITSNTIRASLGVLERQSGQGRAACLALLVQDPGAFTCRVGL